MYWNTWNKSSTGTQTLVAKRFVGISLMPSSRCFPEVILVLSLRFDAEFCASHIKHVSLSQRICETEASGEFDHNI